MPQYGGDSGFSPECEQALTEFLSRIDEARPGDVDAFCARFPEVGDELRMEIHEFQKIAGILQRLAPAGTTSQRMRALFDPDASSERSPEPSLEVEAAGDPRSSSETLRRLSTRKSAFGRYRIKGEIARGGMGAVLRVWDEDLNRNLAMKALLGKGEIPSDGNTPAVDSRTLGRFLEEAQITGQLDHPGIVPVHELGLDDDGQVYFTMKLVKGVTLEEIFGRVEREEDGWNLPRTLGLLLRVCEAMAYAHSKGVVHRDLKPANIMVGRYGEVYVMDWGLARVLEREGDRDQEPADPGEDAPADVPSTEVDDESRDGVLDTPLVTREGDVVGTPAYMSPEQARGELDAIGPASDIYTLGAILYQLLTGQVPYVPRGERISAHAVLARLIQGPPAPLIDAAPQVSQELIAICERAMEREPARRYQSMEALAGDLRAYLEGRVVHAYETGALAELKKWVRRNRPLAGSMLMAVLLLVVGLVTSSTLYVRAEERTADVLRLSAIQDLRELRDRAERLWPAYPENEPGFREWLADAEELVGGLADFRRTLAQIEAGAEPVRGEQGELRFASREESWWHARLVRLVADLEAFADPESGLIEGLHPERGLGVSGRLALALELERRSITGDEAAARWSEACADIADPESCPAYDGLELRPQMGLVPLGRDPHSGLWEFWHVQSGEAPERDEEGAWIIGERTGLVLVLVPAGDFEMGVQNSDNSAANFDARAMKRETPPHRVSLEAFFLSKYEMTQGQWLAFTGSNPSHFSPKERDDGTTLDLRNPVEEMDWNAAERITRRLGLLLPTEAQWEYAARAGTTTRWWTGDDSADLEGAANVADRFCQENGGPNFWAYEPWSDGWAVHAPVGSYVANAFGLHDVHGNVWEWCRDQFGPYSLPVTPGEGLRTTTESLGRLLRGGSFGYPAADARVTTRYYYAPEYQNDSLGLRPSRRIE